MKKIYTLIAIVISSLLALSWYNYITILGYETDSQVDLMFNQVKICSANLHQQSESFENDLRYIIESENWDNFFKNLNSRQITKTRLRRFYAKFQEMIDSIRINGKNKSVLISKDNFNYYSFRISGIKSNSENFVTRNIFWNGSSFNIHYSIYDSKGEIWGNIIVHMNLSRFIREQFRNIYIGPETWEVLFDMDGNMIETTYLGSKYVDIAPEIPQKSFSIIVSQTGHGFEGQLEHLLNSSGEEIDVISVYYPVKIFTGNFGLLFSADKSTLLTSINSNFTVIISFLILSIALIVTVFWVIVKQRNTAFSELATNQKELAELVDQQQLLLTHSNNFVYRHDLEGKINFVTPSVKTVLDYSDREFRSDIYKFISDSEDDRQLMKEIIEKVKEGLEPEISNISFIDKQGNIHILEINAKPIYESGEISGAIGVAKDITDKFTAQQGLKDSEERLRFITENMKDIICLHDPEGRFVYASPSIHDITGMTAEEVKGKQTSEILDILDKKVIKGKLTRNEIDRTEENIVQYKVRHKSRGYIWIETWSQPFRENNGIIKRILSTTKDITLNFEAQQALRQSETQFRSLFEESAIGILIVDVEGKISKVNPIFVNMLGYEPEDFTGRLFTDFIHSEDVGNDGLYYKELLSGERDSYQLEKRFVKENDEVIWGRLTYSMVRDNDNSPLFGIAMVEDISVKKRQEAELRKAKDAAEAGSRAKSEFLATMSHEIRTPLNGVIGMTSLLAETELTREQKEYLDIIRTSGEALQTLISDILDYSKIEAGKMDLEEAPFQLNQCIEEAIDLLAGQAEKKSIELAYLIDENVPEVIQGDISRLRQVLVNLVSNAVKFTFFGEVFINVKKMDEYDDMVKLLIQVRDTGIGIPEDRLGTLFKPFSQIDSSTTRKFGGTGLGLAICKRIVELMNGNIWVKSEEGKGSSFYFTVEVIKVADKTVREYDYDILKNKKLLIVDDNLTNLKIFKTITEKWGLLPETTDSGVNAVSKILQGNEYDLILLDMQMPEMNGIEVAKKISVILGEKSIPIVFVTSFSFSEEEKSEADKYLAAQLTKPIKQSQLFDVLYYIFYSEPKKFYRKEKSLPTGDNNFAENLPLKILVAEDNPVNQKFIVHVLKKLGYTIDVAGTGKEVIEYLESNINYDLIFMDIQMPVMDGYEATRVIIDRWKDTRPKIVALTANALKDDREKCLAVGMDDYMAKPVTVDKIRSMLSAQYESILNDKNGVPGDKVSEEPNEEENEPREEHSENDEKVVDMDILNQYLYSGSEEDRDFFKNILEMSEKSINEYIVDIEKYIGNKDADRLRKLFHTIKGLSYNFGAFMLGEQSKDLELLSADGNVKAVEKKMDDFKKCFSLSIKRIKEIVNKK